MVEIRLYTDRLVLRAHLITYGLASDPVLTARIREEIESMWNEPNARIRVGEREFSVQFRISAEHRPRLDPMDVVNNTDPKNNFFRIEEKVVGNISFVDGLGCNSGFFQADNLYEGSTTAAHEFGHTLGLDHPWDLDLRGRGRPGIMYPRGTLVDPHFQYDPAMEAGLPGGTMHPMHRRVMPADILDLGLDRIRPASGLTALGRFTNVYHSA
jgi:hypothetical protein